MSHKTTVHSTLSVAHNTLRHWMLTDDANADAKISEQDSALFSATFDQDVLIVEGGLL